MKLIAKFIIAALCAVLFQIVLVRLIEIRDIYKPSAAARWLDQLVKHELHTTTQPRKDLP